MRPAQKNNRARGRGNRKNGGGGGGSGNVNRVYESAGPEGKVRGTSQQIIDKYLALARDAQTSGDRVIAENFLQHAEHYQRVLMLATGNQPQERRDQPHEADEDDDDTSVEAAQQPREEQRQQRDDNRQPREERGGQPNGAAPANGAGNGADVGGMTTIDAGGETGGDSLLVEVGENAEQPPQKPKRPRRPRKPAAAKADGEATASSDTPAEQPASDDSGDRQTEGA